MEDRKRLFLLIFIMVVVCVSAVGVTLTLLYRQHVRQERELLQFAAQSQACLIEAIAQHEVRESFADDFDPGPDGWDTPDFLPDQPVLDTTLRLIKEAHQRSVGFGQTGEFVIARREEDQIVFLVSHGCSGVFVPDPVPFDSQWGEPMRRALLGHSGTLIGLDYAGQTVLAAHEPIFGFGLGVVAKIHMSEIRAPFIRSGLAAVGIGSAIILAGSLIFLRAGRPIISRLEARTRELEEEIERRKEAEARLRKSEELSAIASQMAHVGGWEFNPETGVGTWSDEVARIHELDPEDPTGLNIGMSFYEGESRAAIEKAVSKAIQSCVPYDLELEMITAKGNRKWVRTIGQPIKEGGRVVRVQGLFQDITERKLAEIKQHELEAQLLQQQKLESIGTLAGGVAHEINNPINGIMNYAQLIADASGLSAEQREYAEEIIRETDRVSAIVRNLLAFARQEKQQHSPARICDIVNATLSLIRTVIRHDQTALEVDVPEDLPKIKCRSQQIQQVLLNLLTNARDALNERYPGYHPDKKMKIEARVFEKKGRPWVRVTVEDHGSGIPPEVMDRIFDPFFTTKERDKGTGLGLSVSHGIVRNHDGFLSVESELEAYTRFYLDLPVDNGWDRVDVI